jgi:hypothetical protein
MWQPLSVKVGTNFADKRRKLGLRPQSLVTCLVYYYKAKNAHNHLSQYHRPITWTEIAVDDPAVKISE